MSLSSILGVATAFYFLSFTYVLAFYLPRAPFYFGATLIGIAISLVASMQRRYGNRKHTSRRAVVAILALPAIIAVSGSLNARHYSTTEVVKAMGFLSVFLIATSAGLSFDLTAFRACVRACWGGQLLLTIIILFYNNVNPIHGRLMGPFDPVSGGEVGLSGPNDVGNVALVAFVLSPIAGWGGVCISLPITFYAAYLASSRGTLLAIFLAFLVFVTVRESIATSAFMKGRVSPRGFLVMSLLAGTVLLGILQMRAYLLQDIFRINDSDRGVGTGLTGRADRWMILLEEWRKKPLFGHGYSILKTGAIEDKLPLDGGYIMVASELGLFGLFFFLIIIAQSLFVSVSWASRTRNNIPIVMLCYMLAFCLINVVESRIVGATTPVGLFFFFSIVCIAERAEILRGIDNTSLLNELRNR
ncbi:MAG TPA: O-antigen ligase family protein [Planctomycetaceae bacterium]|nr:O-antigen ligase family protein [Planctomycetaceae bacterium]